jgi:hypothetical protein
MFLLIDIDSATIDVLLGRVEVDVCMNRTLSVRAFYHGNVWHGLAPLLQLLTESPCRHLTTRLVCDGSATDLPLRGEHW